MRLIALVQNTSLDSTRIKCAFYFILLFLDIYLKRNKRIAFNKNVNILIYILILFTF